MEKHSRDLAAKSKDVWEDGISLLRTNRANSAANRIYYSVFQAVKSYAVMVGKMNDLNDDDRNSVHKVASELVGAGSGGQRCRARFSLLRGYRQKADYTPDVVTREQMEKLLVDVDWIRKAFIAKAEKEYENGRR